MKPNLVDRTCKLLKWVCNYRKLHNTTTREQLWQYSLLLLTKIQQRMCHMYINVWNYNIRCVKAPIAGPSCRLWMYKVKKLKSSDNFLMENSISELRVVACHMGPHSITCYPTQANTPRLNPSQWRLVLDLPTPEGWKAELTWVAGYKQTKMVYRDTEMVYPPADSHPSKY